MNVVDSIRTSPGEWVSTEFNLVHRGGTKLWIANGLFFCQPEGQSYPLHVKWKAWRAYRWWSVSKPVEIT